MTDTSRPRRSVTVFAASSLDDHPEMVTATEHVVDECQQRDMSITFGGASVGLMGILAHRARHRGVSTVGVIPEFLEDREPPSDWCDTVVRVQSMAERKRRLLTTDALCVLPGGFGTLDELFEAFTLKQLGQIQLPIALINVDGYFDHMLSFVQSCENLGSVVLADRDLFRIFPSASPAFAYLCRWAE